MINSHTALHKLEVLLYDLFVPAPIGSDFMGKWQAAVELKQNQSQTIEFLRGCLFNVLWSTILHRSAKVFEKVATARVYSEIKIQAAQICLDCAGNKVVVIWIDEMMARFILLLLALFLCQQNLCVICLCPTPLFCNESTFISNDFLCFTFQKV